jgi:hypothetical protein
VREKLRVNRHHVFVVAVNRTILNHPDFVVALDDLRFDFTNFSLMSIDGSFLPLMISSRASMTHFGQRLSVVRGQQASASISATISAKAYQTT